MKAFIKPVLIVVLPLFPLFSQQLETSNFSTIVESYGHADSLISNDPSKLWEYALSDAKRKILEQTMIYVKSYSKVENFKLVNDVVQSEAEGFLRIIEQKDIGFLKNKGYTVWLKAEVIYEFNNSYKDETAGPLSVRLWTESDKYHLQQKIKIFFQSNKDCYIKMIYKDAENNVLQIFPNQHRSNNFFKANTKYALPSDSDLFQFTVSEPFGMEKITLFASTSQLGNSDVTPFQDDFFSVKSGINEYALKTRGVKIEKRELPIEFFEISHTIAIVAN